jgi:hypothetical protein
MHTLIPVEFPTALPVLFCPASIDTVVMPLVPDEVLPIVMDVVPVVRRCRCSDINSICCASCWSNITNC